MGCANSKVEDLPAVALCRERCNNLNDAIQQRNAFAEAHVSYIHSLQRIGHSLHIFIHLDYYGGLPSSLPLPLSPKLNLPSNRKGDPVDAGSSPKKAHLQPPPHHSHSHSHSGSHLNFHSDSDDDDDDDEISHLHHSDHSSPLHHLGTPPSGGGGGGHIQYMSSDYLQQDQDSIFPGGGGGFLHMNYMKNKAAPPSVVYQQRPKSPETVRFGDPSTSSSSAAYYYDPPPDNSYPPNNNNYMPYPYYRYPNNGPGGMGGFYGAQPPPLYGSPSPGAAASSSKSAPPPPSPPKASAWDFLNLFEGADDFPYPSYTSSRNSRDVREEEGIPELEDDNYHYQREVVKEVHGDQKFVHGVSPGYKSNPVMMDDGADGKLGGGGGGGGEAEASLYQTRPSTSMENEGVEYEVHVVDTKVVNGEERGSGGGFKGRPRDVSEVAFEIKKQFERASECGNEIAKMLEVGSLRYHRKHASKMLHVLAPPSSTVSSQPSTSKGAEASSSAPPHLEIDEDLAMRSKNLSSTLHKLYLWEKKLYNEVKAEEKMRVVHERKCRKLKRLDEKGAEAHKVDATRTLIRSLSTKIKMAIQVVDKNSITINKIRDEELWPQLNELIQGLSRMWRNMLECHRNQCQALREVKSLGSIGFRKKFSDAHLEATLQLEHEVIDWTAAFSSWVRAQKNYVRALNKWLVNCLFYEPENTPDGPIPFSPGRLGAPPVFVICNQWAQAMERISEKEVIKAMHVFSRSVLQLWEQDVQEMRQRMMTNKDLERKVRNLDREDQKIQKEVQALGKKIVMFAGDGGNLSITGKVEFQSDTGNASLEGSMQRVFEAIEKFVGDSMKAYEELIQRSEEETLARQHEGAS